LRKAGGDMSDKDRPEKEKLYIYLGLIAEGIAEGFRQLIFDTYTGYRIRDICHRFSHWSKRYINSLDEEELLQEICFHIYRVSKRKYESNEGLQSIKFPSNFLIKLAYRKVIDLWRKENPRNKDRLLKREEYREGTGTDYILNLPQEDLKLKYIEGILQAPIEPRYRTLLVKIFIYGKTVAELAEEEGCDLDLMMSRFYRAYRKLYRIK
jgi:DNA-directed RNA polymerase specialized sigma24 family protein